jgi:hypothetical protein
MSAGLCIATDKKGRTSCVVAVKGTFAVNPDGSTHLADEQEPMVYADVHYGDPEVTSIKYECDFAPFKPATDIIVHGHAYSSTGQPVEEVSVGLAVRSTWKQVRVIGDRHWEGTAVHLHASRPVPFLTMPLLFERAFGGTDYSHANPSHYGAELRNPIGVGFHMNDDDRAIRGSPLPNLEDPRSPITSWRDTPAPMGVGVVGRGWHPRIRYAGTYDDAWKENRFPFLPDDFDDRYFLSAPFDQQVPFLEGGEPIWCRNMSPSHVFGFTVPRIDLPLLFRFRDRDVAGSPKLDTLIIEPEAQRVLIVWRASAPLGQKVQALREVVVGMPPRSAPPGKANKPYFHSLAEFIEWKARNRSLTNDEPA